MLHLDYNKYSSGDWKSRNDSAVVASGYVMPSSNRQRQRRRITIRSNKSRKCPKRHRRRKDCYCTNPPVATRINFDVKRHNCYPSSMDCLFPDQDDDQSYKFEPIEKISLYNSAMLQKARELLDYEPSTLFLKKLKAEACKAIIGESDDTGKYRSKYTKARQAYEQYIDMRNKDESLVQPCMCKLPNQNGTDCKRNDAKIQTLCVDVEKKSAATETNNRCCPKCCRCQKDKSTDIEPEPKTQEETPKPQEETPIPQQETPKPQEETPKPQQETPKPQEEKAKPQEKPKQQIDKPKPKENKPKPPAPEKKEKPKENPKSQVILKKPSKTPVSRKKIPAKKSEDCGIAPPLISPEIRDQQRSKKQSYCEYDSDYSCPRYVCSYPKESEQVKGLQLFRNDHFFETHSASDFTATPPKHDCVHLINFDEKCQPHYINADPYGYSRCYICNRAMTTVRNLAAKQPIMENVDTYRKSKLSSLSMTRNAPIAIEPTRIQITNKSQKVMAKLPPLCEETGNFIKAKYQRPVPINSFALRFQKGVYNN